MMRISSSQVYESGTRGIQDNTGFLYRLQNQLSTGRRILTPEDDPIGASEALGVSQSGSVNKQYLDNQAAAASQLNMLDTTLGSVTDELQNIYERAVQAGNGSYDSGQRGMIAEELKQRMQNILGLANTQDGTGLYLFSGFKTNIQPFTVTGAGGNYQNVAPTNSYVTYNGDAGQGQVAVSGSQTVATTESGLDIFMQVRNGNGALTGRSVFDSLQNMVDILDPNSGIPYTQAKYTQALADLNAAVDHVAGHRATIGARMQAVEGLTSFGQNLEQQYSQRLSDLQDLDFAKAITDLSKTQTQLEAVQKAFKTSSQLSLFSIL